jgi:hypothetical protein
MRGVKSSICRRADSLLRKPNMNRRMTSHTFSRAFFVPVSIQETLIQNLYHISAVWGRFKVWTTTRPLASYAATLLFGS